MAAAVRETLLDDARSEVVAEACETMLTDTDAAQRIGQSLKAKDTTLFEKVVQWFRDLATKLREAYKDMHPDSEIAQYAKKTIQKVDGLVQMWADMAVDAAENYRDSIVIENTGRNGTMLSPRVGTSEDGLSMYEGSFPKGTPKSAKSKVILDYIQNVWAKKPIPLNITEADGSQRTILAQFDPTYDPEIKGDASKIAGGNRHGNALEQRVTLDLGPDYHQILSESLFNYSKKETGKDSEAHKGVKTWHYFVDNIYFAEKGSDDFLPFTVSINVKEKETGNFVYSFSAEKRESSTPGTLHAQVSSPISEVTDAEFSRHRVPQPGEKIKQKNSDRNDVESDFYNAGVKYSARVTDKDTLSFLDRQETITTYKTMQIVDGKLYPPMAARIDGKHEDYSVLGVWEQATEHPELIKGNGKFKLDKGKGQGSIEAAYNPYMHSSNLVINDQFTGAYTRDNLVTVECEVPASELTSGYHAQYAKDSVGWHAWHTGTVAGAIRKAKGIERKVFLSRWIKPVRIVTDAEVASMYRDLLDGTDIAVPDNVVTPSLLSELKKAGVTIGESGRVKYSDRYSQLQHDQQAALEKQNRKLREDVERLRELLRLQGKTTGGKLFKPESIKTAANFIMRETGRNLDADGRAEFSGILTKAYTALSDENVTYDDIIRECMNVAEWLDENGETQDALDEYAGGILFQMKGIPISLDETQKAEASFNLTVYTILFHYVRMPPLCKTVIFRETLNKSSAADRRIFSSVRSAQKWEIHPVFLRF